MLLDLAKRLNKEDPGLMLLVSTDGNSNTLGVTTENMGTLYSFTSTDLAECYTKVVEFIGCLHDSEKFDNLIKSILNLPLEV